MNGLKSLIGSVLTNSFVQLALVVLLVGSGVYLYFPLYNGRQLKDRLAQARAERVELEACYPLYLELARLDVPEQWPELVLPPPEKLTERDIAAVTDRFMPAATNSQVELVAVSPRIRLDEQDHRYLAVDLHATGPYGQLRPSCWSWRGCRRWRGSSGWRSAGKRCRSSSRSRCGWGWNRERP